MRRLLALPATLVSVVLAGTLLGPTGGVPADAAAPAAGRRSSRATITPGVQMVTRGAQCTGNFVFTDARDRVYVGYAAHCAGRGEATDTNGCHDPLGRARHPGDVREGRSVATPGTTVGRGTLAYSSWIDMRRRGLNGGPACDYNDFALVRVASGDVAASQPVGAVLGRPERARHRARSRPAAGSTPTATPGCAAAPSRWPPRPGRARPVRRGLDARRLHRHPRHPGRLRLGLPGRAGARVRRAVHGGGGAAARVQRARRPLPRGALRPEALRHRRAAPGRRARRVRPRPLTAVRDARAE